MTEYKAPDVRAKNTWSVYVDGTLRATIPAFCNRREATLIAQYQYPQASTLHVIDHRKPA